MYIVVVGAGNIGRPLVEMATAGGHEVVVVERDPERAAAAADTFDCLVLEADATTMETLEDAGADEADAVISTTDDDAVNIMVMLLADEMGVPARVSVVHNPEHMGLFETVGVTTIQNPQRLIAEYLLQAVQRPTVTDFMHLAGEAEIFEMEVHEGAPIAGLTLTDAAGEGHLGEDVLVVAIERGDETITPGGATELQAGDLVTVFSKHGVTDGITRTFTGEGTHGEG
jgi:trk system potassium uptake protein TrkA